MLPHLLLYAALVNDVRSLVARRDFAAAEHAVAAYQASTGATRPSFTSASSRSAFSCAEW